MFDVRVIPIGAVGTGAKAWQLNFGHQIAGVRIDNKSGSWLLLNDGTFVPPYTIGFGHSFQPTLASIDVLFANGPAGQVTTQQGDNPVVTIYSEPVGESPGVPSGQGTAFVEQFTPTVVGSVSAAISASTGMTSQSLNLPAVANKRYRIFTVFASMKSVFGVPSGPVDNYDSGIYFLVYSQANTNFRAAEGRLNPHHPIDRAIYPIGFDMPVGSAVIADAYMDFSNGSININVTAALI